MGQGDDTARGKRARFEREAMPHLDALYSAASRIGRGSGEAGQLVLETVLRAYRMFDQHRPKADCRAWLLTLLYSGNPRTGSRRGPTQALPPASEEESPREPQSAGAEDEGLLGNPDAVLSQQALDRKVTGAFNSLPADLRRLLILVDVEELNYRQAARVLGCPQASVASRVSRARRMVRKALNEPSHRRGISR